MRQSQDSHRKYGESLFRNAAPAESVRFNGSQTQRSVPFSNTPRNAISAANDGLYRFNGSNFNSTHNINSNDSPFRQNSPF